MGQIYFHKEGFSVTGGHTRRGGIFPSRLYREHPSPGGK